MPPTLNISNGTCTVNLIAASGFTLISGPPGMSGVDLVTSRSKLSDSRAVNMVTHDAVSESWELWLTASSHDVAASQMQGLQRLLIAAHEYHTTGWQASPVYITSKTDNETGTRYSLLNWGEVWPMDNWIQYPYNTNNRWRVQLNLLREPFWRDTAPGTLPASPLTITQPQAPAQASLLFVPNYRNSFPLTHLFNYDASASIFSNNNASTAGFPYFSVSSVTPAACDIVYFGGPSPFFNVIPCIGVSASASATYAWEYYNGAWISASIGTGHLGSATSNCIVGFSPITHSSASDWSTVAINGVTNYWIRCRLSGVTSWTTTPTNASYAPYVANDPYIEIDAADVAGDIPALTRLLMHFASNTATPYANRVIIGAKSRGLTGFRSRFNLTPSDNPPNWSIGFGSDTASAVDISAANGYRAECTFASASGMSSRVSLQCTTASTSTDFAGTYQAYLVCRQIGGVAGDTSVRIGAYNVGSVVYNESVKLGNVNAGRDIIDLGRLILPATGIGSMNNLTIYIAASATSATPDLYLYELVLMPIDEVAMVINDVMPGSSPQTSGFGARDRAVLDSGILYDRVYIDYASNTIAGDWGGQSYLDARAWEQRGRPLKITPQTKSRLFFLFETLPWGVTSGDMLGLNGIGALISIYVHRLWALLRGSE